MNLIDRFADLFRPRAAPVSYSATTLGNPEPEPWLLEALGATPTLTGEVLTKKGAEAIPAVWACKSLLEDDVGRLPLDAYKRGAGGTREKATDTPQHQLVRVRPNPEQTPDELFAMLMFHRLSYGDAYLEIERQLPRGAPGYIRSPPVALWPLLSDRTWAERFEGKKILYTRVREMSSDGALGPAEIRALLPGEYIHISGRSFNGLRSYSPIECAPNSLALSKAQIDWLASFYDGDAQAAAWVSLPSVGSSSKQVMKAKADILRDYLREEHGGLRRAHRLGILPEGAELQKSIVTPREQELVAGMNLSGLDICRLFKVKPHKVAYLERATFTNIVEENIDYIGTSIMPHTTRIKNAFGWALFGPEGSRTMFLEHNYRALLQSTPKEEAEALKVGVVTGWISRAEARQITNMNPAPPEEGLDQFLAQVNQVPSRVLAAMTAQAGSEDGARALYRTAMGLPAEPQSLAPQVVRAELAPAPTAEETREARARRSATQRNRLRIAWEPIFERSAERYVSVEVRAARRALERAGEDLAAFMVALERFWESFPDAIRRELGPVVTGFGAVVGDSISEELGEPVAGPAYDAAVEAVLAAAVGRHIVKSRGAMRGVLADHAGGGAAEAVEARLETWLGSRPGKIAGSESVRTGGRLAQEAYQAGGIREKVWMTFGDSCDLCNALAGQVVGISGSFLAKGDRLDPQKEGTEPMSIDRNIRTAPLHSGCTCGIGAA